MIMFSFLIIVSTASAKDFGTHGPVYPIAERNPVEVIQEQLEGKNLETESLQSADEYKLFAPVEGWSPTAQPRRFQYDPTYTVPQDIKDHTGRVLFKKGEQVNPLELQPMEKTLLFIDGRDTAQVDWALSKHANNSKLILVAGSPKALMQESETAFYFDQGGNLLKTFKIQQIPAVVTISQGEVWVEELILEDDDD